jgi:hypothetical protein
MPRSIRKTSFIAAQNVGFDLVESGNDMPYTGGQHDALVGKHTGHSLRMNTTISEWVSIPKRHARNA